jgi:hypothetical protein
MVLYLHCTHTKSSSAVHGHPGVEPRGGDPCEASGTGSTSWDGGCRARIMAVSHWQHQLLRQKWLSSVRLIIPQLHACSVDSEAGKKLFPARFEFRLGHLYSARAHRAQVSS